MLKLSVDDKNRLTKEFESMEKELSEERLKHHHRKSGSPPRRGPPADMNHHSVLSVRPSVLMRQEDVVHTSMRQGDALVVTASNVEVSTIVNQYD